MNQTGFFLAAKQKGPQANISALERQIDEMVYALYRPAKEEISICISKI